MSIMAHHLWSVNMTLVTSPWPIYPVVAYCPVPIRLISVFFFFIICSLNESITLFGWIFTLWTQQLEYGQIIGILRLLVTSSLDWLYLFIVLFYNIKGLTSFTSARPILCSYLNIYSSRVYIVLNLCLQVKVLAYFASIVHFVMILKFTVLMKVGCRYGHGSSCTGLLTLAFLEISQTVLPAFMIVNILLWYYLQFTWRYSLADVCSCIYQRPSWLRRAANPNLGL